MRARFADWKSPVSTASFRIVRSDSSGDWSVVA